LILVTFNHGLRASEAVGFKADAVRDGRLRMRRLKHSLKTAQPLLEHADPLLNERAAVLELARKTGRIKPLFKMAD
jgi:hypothetical protein